MIRPFQRAQTFFASRKKKAKYGIKLYGSYWLRQESEAIFELGIRGNKTRWKCDPVSPKPVKTVVPEGEREFIHIASITPDKMVVTLPLRRGAKEDALGEIPSSLRKAFAHLDLYVSALKPRTVRERALRVQLREDLTWSAAIHCEISVFRTFVYDGKQIYSDDAIPQRKWNKYTKRNLNEVIRSTRLHLAARAKLGAFDFLVGVRGSDIPGVLSSKCATPTEIRRYVRSAEDLLATLEAVDPEDITTFFPIIALCTRYQGPNWYWNNVIPADIDWVSKFDAFIRANKESLLRASGAVVYSVAPNASAEEQNEPDGNPDPVHSDLELQQAVGLRTVQATS